MNNFKENDIVVPRFTPIDSCLPGDLHKVQIGREHPPLKISKIQKRKGDRETLLRFENIRGVYEECYFKNP